MAVPLLVVVAVVVPILAAVPTLIVAVATVVVDSFASLVGRVSVLAEIDLGRLPAAVVVHSMVEVQNFDLPMVVDSAAVSMEVE